MKIASTSTVHKLPTDFKAALAASRRALAVWNDITPLARSEWICWVISGKLAKTRSMRIKKGISKLSGGMRRPCCWAGCMHRTDKPLSRSQKFVLSRRSGK